MNTIDTNLLSVDRNTPLARAMNQRINQDAFLRDFGRPDPTDTLNERDNTTLTRNYLNQEFKRKGQLLDEDFQNYQALSEFQREKLSYQQYNKANMVKFMPDYAIPLRDTQSRYKGTDQTIPRGALDAVRVRADQDFGDPNDIDTYNRKTLEQLTAEKIATSGGTDRRNHLIIERLLNEITGAGDVAHDGSHLTSRGDDAPVIKLDKRLFELKADKILPKHKLLKLLDPISVKVLLNHTLILKVRDG